MWVFFYLLPRRDRMRMDKRLVGLTWEGRDGYIAGSELQANMKRMDTSLGMKDNSESALSTNRKIGK